MEPTFERMMSRISLSLVTSERTSEYSQLESPNELLIARLVYVRFGSKADIGACPRDVRYSPKADMGQQGRDVCQGPGRDMRARSALALKTPGNLDLGAIICLAN